MSHLRLLRFLCPMSQLCLLRFPQLMSQLRPLRVLCPMSLPYLRSLPSRRNQPSKAVPSHT